MNKGSRYEQAAASFLRRQGFRIIHRNYRTRWGEIDIIAEKKGTVHFIEVKGRTKNAWFSPEEAVRRTQLRRIYRCAQAYCAEHGLEDTAMCMSLVGVRDAADGLQSQLLENIYEPEEF